MIGWFIRVSKAPLFALALIGAGDAEASAMILGVGDSTVGGYCTVTPNQRLLNIVAANLGETTITNLGSNGLQTNTVIMRELPQVVANAYDVVVVSTGTNDMNDYRVGIAQGLHLQPFANYITIHERLLADLRMLEPTAIIVDVGVRDIGYDDPGSYDKVAFMNQITSYNSGIMGYIAMQPGMVYVPTFPQAPLYAGGPSFPQYYTPAVACGAWHLKIPGQALLATSVTAAILAAEYPATTLRPAPTSFHRLH